MRLFCCFAVWALLCGAVAWGGVTLHVAPGGRDGAAGTREAPLATMGGARDRVRQVKKQKPDTPITVLFAAGIYAIAERVEFSSQDSGSASAPIVYRAAPGAEVRLSGGREITNWSPCRDEAVPSRLPGVARPHVRVTDLKAQGIGDYGKHTVHGFGHGSQAAEAELFCDDVPMRLARWPNSGFRGIKTRKDIQHVVVDTDRVARWTEESDPWVFAYWHHDWAELHEPIAGIVSSNTLVRSEKITPKYGITPGRARWYAYNLLSELDEPGEFYLDRTAGKLYFWPPTGSRRAVLSQRLNLIRAEDLSHVTFQGFTVEAFRSTAITIDGGTNCRVVGCTLRNIAHRAVRVIGGKRHVVYGCDVYQTGDGGITMAGGDRKTLTPGGHNAENNHVHHYSRRARTYRPGIVVSGVGNRIAHNLVHDGPHMALSAGGNDHVVEYNEVHNVVQESGDAGAYYVGRDWTKRGGVVRFNYWHQIVGATGHGGMTIYLDDQYSGHTIYGNLFERCSRAVFIGGGDDNVVTNNVFLDCWKAAHIDNRGMNWQKAATDDPKGQLRTRFAAMPVDSALWKQRYPMLAGTLEDEPNIPKRNRFTGNLSAGGSWDDIHAGTRSYQTVENNLVFDDDRSWIRLIKDQDGQPLRLEFKDPAAVKKMGFTPLPLSKMGVYKDPRRASWPVRHTVREIKLPE